MYCTGGANSGTTQLSCTVQMMLHSGTIALRYTVLYRWCYIVVPQSSDVGTVQVVLVVPLSSVVLYRWCYIVVQLS
jgi:hypothetical protein